MTRPRYRQLVMMMLMFMSVCYGATTWQQLAPGLSYCTIDVVHDQRSGRLHAFKVNLKKYKLKIAFAKDFQRPFASVRSLVMNNDALIGINGGFFTPQMHPLGLRISDGMVKNHLKRTPWWGVLQVSHHYPRLYSLRGFSYDDDIDFAIQSGPRLIVSGTIPLLKDGQDSRSALGITKNKELIIVATQNIALTTTELAKILRASNRNNGLACIDALNLDGGSSTQIYANINNFYLNIASFAPITDAVLVMPR